MVAHFADNPKAFDLQKGRDSQGCRHLIKRLTSLVRVLIYAHLPLKYSQAHAHNLVFWSTCVLGEKVHGCLVL